MYFHIKIKINLYYSYTMNGQGPLFTHKYIIIDTIAYFNEI